MIDPENPPDEEAEESQDDEIPGIRGKIISGLAWILFVPIYLLVNLLDKFGFYLAIFLIALSFGQYLPKAIDLITFPHELRYGEAVVADQVRRVSEEPGLYPANGSEKRLINQNEQGKQALLRLFQHLFE